MHSTRLPTGQNGNDKRHYTGNEPLTVIRTHALGRLEWGASLEGVGGGSVANGLGKRPRNGGPEGKTILTTCEHDIDREGAVLLNPENDCLARDRGTLSVGTAPSDGRGVRVGGAEEGWLMGQKIEGRSAFTMVAY